jgi:hypothetical protein
MPAAGSRGRAVKFVLAAAAGLALASGVMTGTPAAAHAATAVSARAAATVHAYPVFEPCPCTDRLCREVCFQGVASGGPAAMIHRQTHPATPQVEVAATAIAVNCPPPSTSALASSDGNPGC